MTPEAPRNVEIPSSTRDRIRFTYPVDKAARFLLEDGLVNGQLQEMKITMSGRIFRLTIGQEGKVPVVHLYQELTGEGRHLQQVELDPPHADFQRKQLIHGRLGITLFQDAEGNRLINVRDTQNQESFTVQSTAAPWDEVNVDGLSEPGTLSLLGEDSRFIMTPDQKIAAHTKKGYRHGKDKPINEDGCVIMEDEIVLFDGISTGGKGALAVKEAAKAMSHQAKKGMWPARLMHLGAQKMASVRRKLDLDPDQDGAAACVVRNKPDRIECATVADSKIRIFDVTAGSLEYTSGEQNTVGDVAHALTGTDVGQTGVALVNAAESGFYMGWGTQKKVAAILDGQARREVAPHDVQREISRKVKERVSSNPITSSLNARGDLDKAPLSHVFQKIPGHQYLVLVHTDGLIVPEGEVTALLKQANGEPRQAVRLLRAANEAATAPERLKGVESGYIDDCTVAAMAA